MVIETKHHVKKTIFAYCQKNSIELFVDISKENIDTAVLEHQSILKEYGYGNYIYSDLETSLLRKDFEIFTMTDICVDFVYKCNQGRLYIGGEKYIEEHLCTIKAETLQFFNETSLFDTNGKEVKVLSGNGKYLIEEQMYFSKEKADKARDLKQQLELLNGEVSCRK